MSDCDFRIKNMIPASGYLAAYGGCSFVLTGVIAWAVVEVHEHLKNGHVVLHSNARALVLLPGADFLEPAEDAGPFLGIFPDTAEGRAQARAEYEKEQESKAGVAGV